MEVGKSPVSKPRPPPAVTKKKGRNSSNEKPTRRVQCKVSSCGYSTPHPKDLVRHMRKHTGEKPYACEACSKAFSRHDKLELHKRTHEGLKTYECSECSYACVDPSSLRRHLRTHSDSRPYKCQLCPYSSKNSTDLTIHTRFHTGDSPYPCNYAECGKFFKTPSDLRRHTRSHSGIKPYKCDKCNYSSANKCNLITHMKRRHTQDETPVPADLSVSVSALEAAPLPSSSKVIPDEDLIELIDGTKPDLPFDFACKSCPFKCDSIRAFKMHMKRKHKDHGLPLVKGPQKPNKSSKSKDEKVNLSYKFVKMYQCTKCSASFVGAESLKCHMRQHAIPAPRPMPKIQLLSPNPGVTYFNPEDDSDPPSNTHSVRTSRSNPPSTIVIADLQTMNMNNNFYQARS